MAALLVAAAPAAAKPVTETASLGEVRAELSYDTRKNRPPVDIVMRVFQGDAMIVEEAIDDKDFLSPAAINADEDSVRVIDLDGDGIGEAIFDLFTGGAHCCSDTRIYQGAKLIKLFTADVGYVLEDFDDDGVPEIRTADTRFLYRYSSYAASLPPLQVLRLRDGEFQDVTSQAGRALRSELRYYTRLNRRFRREDDPALREVIRSSLAAIAATRCSLGDCAKGLATVDRAVRRGDIGRKFRRKVRRDLKRWGYRSPGA